MFPKSITSRLLISNSVTVNAAVRACVVFADVPRCETATFFSTTSQGGGKVFARDLRKAPRINTSSLNRPVHNKLPLRTNSDSNTVLRCDHYELSDEI